MKNLSFRTKTILVFILFIMVGVVSLIAFDTGVGFVPSMAMSLIPLADLERNEETCNMAGIATIVYVARTADIATWPALTGTKTLPEHTVDLVGDFVMEEGKYFHTFYSTQEMGELISAVEGPRDGQYFRNTGSFFYPFTTSRALGLANLLAKSDVVIILKEFNGTGTGVMRVVGSSLLPAMIKPSTTSGKAFADQRGITFNFDAPNCSVPYVYTGSILTSADEVNTPTQLELNATEIDGLLGTRFVPNESQSLDLDIATYSNFDAGSTIRVENNLDLNLVLALADGGSATLTENKYADLFFVTDNNPVIINSNL